MEHEKSEPIPIDIDALIAKVTNNLEERTHTISASLQKIKELKALLNERMEQYNHFDTKAFLSDHEKEMNEIQYNYEQFMITRDKEAKLFIHEKTMDELRAYLATKSIPYNDWKDADYETLANLTFQMFEG